MSAGDPELPRNPADYRPKPLLGVSFWIMIVFGLLCVFAGAGVALLAPRLLGPPRPATAPMTPAPAPLKPAPSPSADESSSAEEVGRLRARIADLETAGVRSSEAVAAALAVAQLVEASQASGPFVKELSALRQAAPDLPEVAALAPLADAGAPSRTALATDFPTYAARAAAQARRPAEGAPFRDRLAYAAAKLVVVRRVDDLSGDSSDALIARAEAALNAGDVLGALRLLDGLPPEARKVLAPWRLGAERRADVDREVAALRARAIRALASEGSAT